MTTDRIPPWRRYPSLHRQVHGYVDDLLWATANGNVVLDQEQDDEHRVLVEIYTIGDGMSARISTADAVEMAQAVLRRFAPDKLANPGGAP